MEYLSHSRLMRKTNHQSLCLFDHLQNPSRLTGCVLRTVLACQYYNVCYRSKAFHAWTRSESNSPMQLTINDASK